MRYRKVILVAAVLSALVGGPALWAQANATLQGKITDAGGAPLPGAVVSVTGERVSRTATADRTGFFKIPDLAPGNYRLSASLDAFAPEARDIELHAGQSLTQNLRLALVPYSENVVVTAQKRAETLVEVPSSVAVLGGDTLENHRVENLQDLATLVSGLTVTGVEAGSSRLTMRGINTGGVASTVGVYTDDVPFGSSSGLANGAILAGDFDTFDLARIEVLRGPQGTLYGASSVGGALKYVLNQPTTAGFEARVLGSSETVEGGGAGYSWRGLANVPFGNQFALRATGFYRSDDGFIDSIGNNPVASLKNPAINIINGTRVARNINTVTSSGGHLSGLYAPSEKFSLLLTAQLQDLKSGAPNAVDADPATLKPLQSGEVQSSYYKQPVKTKYRISSATANWDLGAASLASVTSYSTFDQNLNLDATIASGLTGGPPLASLVTSIFGNDVTRPLSALLPQTTSTDKVSQELRLVSPKNKTFEWLIGGYYTHEKSLIHQEIHAVEAATGNLASGIPNLAVVSLASTYKEVALFGNTTWHLTPQFDLSAGARASRNDQVASQIGDGPLAGGHTEFDNLKSSESPFTYSVSGRWAQTANSSIYARVATGFRPGGPNVLPPNVPAGTPLTYKSDSLTSYEAGWKASGAGGRSSVDLSAFFLDWKDIQLFTVVNGFGINANGGTAKSKGAELTASLIPTNGLTFSLNGAYTDSVLTKATDPRVGGLDGDPLPFTPKWAAALRGDYEWDVRNGARAFVGGGIGYTGDRTFDFTSRTGAGDLRRIGSYETLELRAGTEFGRWLVELYGKNLANEKGIATVDAAGAFPNRAVGLAYIRPRTIGLSLGVRAW
ncbi:MAG TPA: TonB-dependent receptor [Gemmatimonadaceae bacterium]